MVYRFFIFLKNFLSPLYKVFGFSYFGYRKSCSRKGVGLERRFLGQKSCPQARGVFWPKVSLTTYGSNCSKKPTGGQTAEHLPRRLRLRGVARTEATRPLRPRAGLREKFCHERQNGRAGGREPLRGGTRAAVGASVAALAFGA